MRRKLKINQSLRVRWLLPLLVCLLLPAGMQAEDYGLTVAGTQVTSDNASGVTGDNITGTITFDATTNTLTLNGATVNGKIVNNLESLIIHLQGTNSLTSEDEQDAALQNGESDATLSFTGSGSLAINSEGGVIGNFSSIDFGSFNLESQKYPGIYYDDTRMQSYDGYLATELTITTDEVYPVWVYDPSLAEFASSHTQITASNKNDVLGDGTVSFSNSTITLNGATLKPGENSAIVVGKGMSSLTVHLLGTNTFSSAFYFTDETNLIFTTDTSNPGSLEASTLANWSDEGERITYKDGLVHTMSGNTHVVDRRTLYYGLNVAGIRVTNLNADDVMNDGKVKWDNGKKKLTLNNAELTGGIEWNSSDGLTIALNGENSITCSGETSAIKATVADTYPALSFVKDESATSASLMLTVSNSANTISGFNYPINHEGMFMINSENEMASTTLVTSTILSGGSGTSSDPLIIKTADDLKNFSEYIKESIISNTSCVKLSNDISEDGIDCSSVTVNPIGYGNTFFAGTFDGNGKTIKNLTIADDAGDCAGFFRILGEGGMIVNLTLDNLTLSGGNSSSNNIGGLVGCLNGGTINNCTIKNSTVSCLNNSQNPTVGGVVGSFGYDTNSTITNCIVDNCTIKAETADTWASGANANAGGILGRTGYSSEGTITGCQVKGKTTVKADYGAYSADDAAGAIVGNKGGESTLSLSDNSYEYDVTVLITKYDGSATSSITMSGYDQRAIGGRWDYVEQGESYVYEYVASEDVSANNGAVLYTKTVILPKKTENDQVTIEGRQGNYYVMADNGYRVAPNQTVTLDVTPTEEYALSSFTVTNNMTGEPVATTSSEKGEYSFVMPDSDVEVFATTVAAYPIMLLGERITELNVTDVFGDGTVSYDADSNTLTLNSASIGNGGTNPEPVEFPGIDYSGTADLTISLKGNNTIQGLGGCEAIRYNGSENNSPTLIFAKGDTHTCTLQLNAEQSSVISTGFGDVRGINGINAAKDNNLKINTESTVLYSKDNGLYVNADTHLEPVTSANIVSVQVRADIVWKAGEGNYSYEIDDSEVTADAGGYYIYTNGETPWLNNPDNLAVTFSSSDESVATIDSKGTITFVGMGRTTISATVAETDELLETTSSFTLKVYPENAEFEKMFDLLFPGETVTITCKTADAEIWYYTGNQSRDDAVKYTGPIVLTTIGETNIMAFTKSTKNDEVFESSTAVSGRFVVFEQPTISVASGTFNDDVEVTIGKLPTRYGTQVCYYFNDELSDDIYTSTDMLDETKYHVYVEDEVIKIIESKILKVFIMEQDSGKYYKKKAAEEEYTVIPKTELNISYAQNSREWASYYADEKSLETPTGLQAYVVTEVQETGVTTSPISYIPQGEGILLKRTENIQEPIMAKAFMDVEPETASNKLKGTATSKSVKTENGDVYVLYNDGFTRAPSGSIPAHRAYLVLNDESAGARLLIWEDEETTGVSSVETESRQNNDTYYNLNGQRVNKPTKGLYICKGKKHIVK